MPLSKPRLGISSCLLGCRVRYDGQHKRDPLVVDLLGPFVEWIPVCPEVEIGMGVPREPIRLVGRSASPRLVAERSGKDHTGAMHAFAERRVAELGRLGLDGYVTKSGSPSCGLARIRVWPARGGPPSRKGVGAFARVLVGRMPLLPVVEEERLHDPALRESFVERVFAHARFRAAAAGGMTRGALARFHARNETVLLAHSPAACGALAAIVRRAATRPLARVVADYARGFMAALAIPATRAGHANALRRLVGRLRRALDDADVRELEGLVSAYRRGVVPLVVPLTLVRHHVGRAGVAELAEQAYLDPDPTELWLRNHA